MIRLFELINSVLSSINRKASAPKTRQSKKFISIFSRKFKSLKIYTTFRMQTSLIRYHGKYRCGAFVQTIAFLRFDNARKGTKESSWVILCLNSESKSQFRPITLGSWWSGFGDLKLCFNFFHWSSKVTSSFNEIRLLY